MPLIGTRGAASAQGFGEFAQSAAPVYIEDVFSTYLYTGNSSTQTITNGIDLSGKGGLVWIKTRSGVYYNHNLMDTARGMGYLLESNTTAAQQGPGGYTTASSTGFSINVGYNGFNASGQTYASWTFRKQPKFFDVVTYTGNGTANNTIPHALGSTVGAIFIKNITNGSNWIVWHRSNSNEILCLNLANANIGSYSGYVHDVTSTSFQVGTSGQPNPGTTNASGDTYVAYLFAHDAGGFGTAGTDNVISCGSYTTDGSGNATISLGYEPQWVMIKNSSTTSNWVITDNMRGMPVTTTDATLRPNTNDDEVLVNTLNPTATGFQVVGQAASNSFIYIAIRRGPMKTPTSGTSVFSANATNAQTYYTTGFPVDAVFAGRRAGGSYNFQLETRLLGDKSWLVTSTLDTELTPGFTTAVFDNNTQSYNGSYSNSTPFVFHNFQRAPGFMDVVCYAGTSSVRTVNHNLTVAPELIITKVRNPSTSQWYVYAAPLGATKFLVLNATDAQASFSALWNDTAPTSTVFTLGDNTGNNEINRNMVAYLFASCPGVSKVGSYSGTGGTQTISCGFAARYVLIKRTDSTGDWWVWDTARGMVSGTDPRLGLNLQTTEQNADWVYTNASGFQIVTTDATVNASGGSYIFLAIA